MTSLLNSLLRPKPKAAVPEQVKLDSATVHGMTLDAAGEFAQQYLRSAGVAVINQWATTDDLDDGENFGDRLVNMFVGIVNDDDAADLTEDELDAIDESRDAAYDYLETLKVPEADIESLLNDFDADVAARVRELVAANLPEGDEAESELLDAIVFTPEDQEPVMDAVYRKKVVVRNGKKVKIRKRIAGTVHRTARQKLAIKKALRKAHTGQSLMRRMRSMRARKRYGL